MSRCLVVTATWFVLATPALAQSKAGAPTKSAGKSAPDPLKAEKTRLEKVRIDNEFAAQQVKKKLRNLLQEKEELDLRVQLLEQRKKVERAELEAQQQRLDAENKLALAKQQKSRQARDAQLKELEVRNAITTENFKAELANLIHSKTKLGLIHESTIAALRRELDKVRADNDLAAEKQRAIENSRKEERARIELEVARLKLQAQTLQNSNVELKTKLARIEGELTMRAKKEAWRSEVDREPVYAKSPFGKGVLTISDRRIPLNGAIYSGVADYVTERIHFFNNESKERPIFLVIDRSPGGSVMEGYRIVKAIQASEAPVHVVVKQYAASMAAVIVTLADESYAYPNAVLLHHQMSTLTWGNMTQLKEQLEIARRWEKRLMVPVAKRLGLGIDEFRKRMYKANSDGDWEEFADVASKLGWVKHVVGEIRETGVLKRPADGVVKKNPFALSERRDEHGLRYVELPRLPPYDLYFIHNPDNYYR